MNIHVCVCLNVLREQRIKTNSAPYVSCTYTMLQLGNRDPQLRPTPSVRISLSSTAKTQKLKNLLIDNRAPALVTSTQPNWM